VRNRTAAADAPPSIAGLGGVDAPGGGRTRGTGRAGGAGGADGGDDGDDATRTTIAVTTPVVGQECELGGECMIGWSAVGAGASVSIELLPSGSAPNSAFRSFPLAPSVPASAGLYRATIPGDGTRLGLTEQQSAIDGPGGIFFVAVRSLANASFVGVGPPLRLRPRASAAAPIAASNVTLLVPTGADTWLVERGANASSGGAGDGAFAVAWRAGGDVTALRVGLLLE
jgi:hypothetical protein